MAVFADKSTDFFVGALTNICFVLICPDLHKTHCFYSCPLALVDQEHFVLSFLAAKLFILHCFVYPVRGQWAYDGGLNMSSLTKAMQPKWLIGPVLIGGATIASKSGWASSNKQCICLQIVHFTKGPSFQKSGIQCRAQRFWRAGAQVEKTLELRCLKHFFSFV